MCPYTEEAFPINGLLWGYFIGNLWIPVTRGQSCRAVMSPMLPARTSFHFWIGIGVVQVVQYCYLYWWLVYTIHRARIYDNWTDISPDVGVTKSIFPFRYFPNSSERTKHLLHVWYHVGIWQVSPQLSCGDIWQIWTWLKVSDLYVC